MNVTLKWTAVAGVVAACVLYLVHSASGSAAAYYETIGDLRTHPASGDARVLGTVEDDVRRSDGGLTIAFTATDGSASMPVVYRGALPDIFRPGMKVVVEGQLAGDGVFHARTLLAKCPSRFSAAQPAT